MTLDQLIDLYEFRRRGDVKNQGSNSREASMLLTYTGGGPIFPDSHLHWDPDGAMAKKLEVAEDILASGVVEGLVFHQENRKKTRAEQDKVLTCKHEETAPFTWEPDSCVTGSWVLCLGCRTRIEKKS